MNKTLNRVIESGLAGLAAGAVAGAFVGFGEGVSIFLGDTGAGGFAPLYGGLFYAVLLGLGGAPFGAFVGLVGHVLKREAWEARWAWTATLVALVTPVALVVLRFRIIRDVFHEKLAIGSGAGIGVHLGLVVFGAVLALALWRLTSPSYTGKVAEMAWPKLSGAVLAALVVCTIGWTGCVPVSTGDGEDPCVAGICQEDDLSSTQGGWKIEAPSSSAAVNTSRSPGGWVLRSTTAPHSLAVTSTNRQGGWSLETGRNIRRVR